MKFNKDLVDALVQQGTLHSPRLIEAFLKIDRRDFVLVKNVSEAYEDAPLAIGYEATISQPTTVALMLEWLDARPGEKVLDIGSGSGWTTALLACLVGRSGKVTGLEIVPELVELGKSNLAKYNLAQAQVIQAQENTLGLPDEFFDKILVSAAASEYPSGLIDQLNAPGRLVVPIRQSVYKIDKDLSGEIYEEKHPGFFFVPLR